MGPFGDFQYPYIYIYIEMGLFGESSNLQPNHQEMSSLFDRKISHHVQHCQQLTQQKTRSF